MLNQTAFAPISSSATLEKLIVELLKEVTEGKNIF